MERDELVRLAGEQALLKHEQTQNYATQHRHTRALQNLAGDNVRGPGWGDKVRELVGAIEQQDAAIGEAQRRLAELKRYTGID